MEEIKDVVSLGVKFASAKLDGIQFNKIQYVGINYSARTVQKTNPWSPEHPSTSMAYTINAVDIDWNNAVIPYGNLETGENVNVKTTGELLSLISKMQQEIFELSATVTALNNNAVIKGSDTSMAKVTINFDGSNVTAVSINGNPCNSGDVNYYRVGTVLDFDITPSVISPSTWYAIYEVNEVDNINANNTSYTYQSDQNSNKFSLLVNTSNYITVDVSLTVTSAQRPNPNPGLWPETTDSGVSGEDAL